MRLKVHVQPKASRNKIKGWQADELRVAIHAPPVDGAANAGLIDFLCDELGLRPRQCRLLSGESSRHKVLELDADDAIINKKLEGK